MSPKTGYGFDLQDNDWVRVRQLFQMIGSSLRLGPTSTPRFTGLTSEGNLMPVTDNAYDIGETTTPLRWKNIECAGSGRFDGGIGIGADPAIGRQFYLSESKDTPGKVRATITNTGTGSAMLHLFAGSDWAIGVKNSDSDKLIIAQDNALASNIRLSITTAGAITGGTYNTLSIIPTGGYIYLSGDGTTNTGLDIAIPMTSGGDFFYGYGGTEHHKFGNSSQVEISDDGLITADDLLVNDYDGGSTRPLEWFPTDATHNYLESGSAVRIGLNAYSVVEAIDGANDWLTVRGAGTGSLALNYGACTGGVRVYDGGTTNYLQIIGSTIISSGAIVTINDKLDVQAPIYPVVNIQRNLVTSAAALYGGARLKITTGDTAQNNFGIGFYFEVPDDAGNSTYAGAFGGRLSTVANGSEIGDIVFIPSYHNADPGGSGRVPALILRAAALDSHEVRIPYRLKIGADAAPTVALDVTGDIKFSGGLQANLVTKTGAYTATASDFTIICNAFGGAFTITLPAVASHTGRIYHIKKIDSSANTVTVDGNSSETIDDSITAILTAQYESITIQSDGSEWWII